ncbi:MAG: SH3 domain-containing protein [Planctomycetes bacterium]|nr:SH3 domain-containing protein [Planctomycetota bacterium]
MRFSATFVVACSIFSVVAMAPRAEAQFNGVNAAKVYKVTASSLNVRTGPSTRYGRVGSLPRGRAVYVHRFQAGWAQITFGGVRRWTSARYLTRGSIPAPAPRRPAPSRPTPTRPARTPSVPGANVTAATYEITYSRLNIRTGPSTRYGIVATYSRGARVRVTRRSGNWNAFTRSGRLVWAYGPGMKRAATAPPRPRPTTPPRPLQVGSPVRTQYTLKVKVQGASLRTLPRATGTRIRGLIRNQLLTVVRYSGDYRGVKTSRYSAFAGWVHRSLLVTRTGSRPPSGGAAPTPPRPSTPPPVSKTRSGGKSKSVGNSTLGAKLSRNCSATHSRSNSSANEAWTLRGRLLGSTPRIAGARFRMSARAGGGPSVTTKKFALLGSEFTISGTSVSREAAWIRGKTIWRGPLGPVTIALRLTAGVRATTKLSVGRGTVTITGSSSLFGEAEVEFDAGLVRAGVRATVNIIKVSLPARLTFSRSSVRLNVDYVVSSNIILSAYVIVGRKVWGVGYEKEFSVDILSYTLRETRYPILSATVSGS